MSDVKEKVLEVLRKDPIKFARVVCKYELTDYQRRFLLDRSKRRLFVAGRQVGKSTCSALEALWFSYCFPNKHVLVIAPSERQARIIFDKIHGIVRWHSLLNRDCEKLTMDEIRFKNGSIVRVLPVGLDASTARGFTADMLIVDEAQLVPDAVFSAMMPSLAVKDGIMVVLGTPGGREGFFYRAWISEGWSKHVVKSTESPFISSSFLREYRELYGEEMFRREMLAEFLDLGDLFFDMNKVNELAKLDLRVRPIEGEVYWAGLDIATVGEDESVMVFMTQNENSEMYEVRGVFNLSKRAPKEIVMWVVDKVERWKPAKIVVDETGVGEGILAMLREKLSGHGLEGFKFSTKLRYELYANLKRLIEDEKILLPNEPRWVSQFAGFRFSKRSDGRQTIKKVGKKDDFVDALALACWGVERGGRVEVLKFGLDELYV